MPRRLGNLSATFIDGAVEDAATRLLDFVRFLIDEYMADGYPPGAERLPERDEFMVLQQMAQMGSPLLQSPAARRRLEELGGKFGASAG